MKEFWAGMFKAGPIKLTQDQREFWSEFCDFSVRFSVYISLLLNFNNLKVENNCKQEQFILRLTFNPRLVLTGFRTTRPWYTWIIPPVISYIYVGVNCFLNCRLRSSLFSESGQTVSDDLQETFVYRFSDGIIKALNITGWSLWGSFPR